jgi:hypothetical protein
MVSKVEAAIDVVAGDLAKMLIMEVPSFILFVT